MIRITAYGSPAPQGSKKFVGMVNGHGMMLEMSKKVKPWREDVKAAAEAVRAGAEPLDGPLVVRMVFTMPKPASAPKRRKTYPMRTPDLSKLCRSTEDALTQAGIWRDDARVVEYERLAKVYPGEDAEALEAPGVRIEIHDLSVALSFEEFKKLPPEAERTKQIRLYGCSTVEDRRGEADVLRDLNGKVTT